MITLTVVKTCTLASPSPPAPPPLGRITWQICHVGTCSYTSVNVPTSARIADTHSRTYPARCVAAWLSCFKFKFWTLCIFKSWIHWTCNCVKQSHICRACVGVYVCGIAAPGRGPIPCHSETTSQSFLGSKISCPPPSVLSRLTCALLISTSHLQTDRRPLREGCMRKSATERRESANYGMQFQLRWWKVNLELNKYTAMQHSPLHLLQKHAYVTDLIRGRNQTILILSKILHFSPHETRTTHGAIMNNNTEGWVWSLHKPHVCFWLAAKVIFYKFWSKTKMCSIYLSFQNCVWWFCF